MEDKMKKEKIAQKPSVIKQLIQTVEKQFGKGTIMCMGNGGESENPDLKVISTGSISLDIATGIMGYPCGRLIEIFGPESSGKTTLALHAIASVQQSGGIAAFIDTEHAFDMVYAKGIGVDVGNLLVSQPDYGEQALEIAEILVRSGGVDIIVIDSVAALVPKAEIEGDMGDSHMGLQARLMSQAMRKLTAITHRFGACIIFINQIRQKIGVMFGNPETTTGGTALKFYSSMRLEVRRIGTLKNGEDVTGSRTRVKIVKNKMAPPFREAEFDIIFGKGIDFIGDLFNVALQYNVIEKNGSWYSFNGKELNQGKEKSIELIKQSEDMVQELKCRVVEVSKGISSAGTESTAA